jgi:hypothetical protein
VQAGGLNDLDQVAVRVAEAATQLGSACAGGMLALLLAPADVSGAATNDGAQVIQWTADGGAPGCGLKVSRDCKFHGIALFF